MKFIFILVVLLSIINTHESFIIGWAL